MKAFRKRLLAALFVILMDSASALAQPRELGTGKPSPIKAPHLCDREELIVAALDLSAIDRESMAIDVTGHCTRPDAFSFSHSPIGRRQ